MCKITISLGVFFSILKFLFSGLSGGRKGKKWPKMTKIFVCRTIHFRNHISYDLHLWYTFMYKKIISPAIFFHFFKILIFGIIRGEVKGQKMAQNDKKFCPYLRNRASYDCDFWCTFVKWWYLQQIFSFFRILIFGVFRGIKGKKWPKITSFSLFCSISQELDHIKILIMISAGVFHYYF